MDSSKAKRVPITVFTGFLGSGKTTIILDIVKNAPPGYNIVLLKNEFGDAETDSALALESNLQVSEMINGCLCCVLVGQMKNAILEIYEKYQPDRILIETSGSAFPAPIAWQIRQMKENNFDLDSILTVIDCENFVGYEDTSYTAKLQAQYTDLILLNKIDSITERQLDVVIDHVNELNTDTPKFKVYKGVNIPLDLVFGIDTKLFELGDGQIVISKDSDDDNSEYCDKCSSKDSGPHTHHSHSEHLHENHLDHHQREIDVINVRVPLDSPDIPAHTDSSDGNLISDSTRINQNGENVLKEGSGYKYSELEALLKAMPSEDVYRVKGVIKLSGCMDDLRKIPEFQFTDPVSNSLVELTDKDNTSSNGHTEPNAIVQNRATSSSSAVDSGYYILNFAFSRFNLIPITNLSLLDSLNGIKCKFVFMGISLRFHLPKIISSLSLNDSEITAHYANCL
ncbi:hypothetical protein BB560_002765 [Smittium megazygosporum]|uniref:CobW/HypB/UreG nucleotide-binding domain-containing protein n=1 Tax=Smittium megazygosporum TaxID=133381 RepID=A0A2T9ZDW1_9FUNG|nr:hypothetical protein BB560_002765 [Smittium megazygosporum]